MNEILKNEFINFDRDINVLEVNIPLIAKDTDEIFLNKWGIRVKDETLIYFPGFEIGFHNKEKIRNAAEGIIEEYMKCNI